MDLFDLTGKVAIVTGGNSGIGLGIATGLARAGAAVYIAARDKAKTDAAVEGIRKLGGTAHTVVADATKRDDIARLMDTVVGAQGRLDILVNNAGGIVRKRPEEHSVDEWEWMLELCLSSTWHCSMAAYPHLKAAGGGKVINNGSMGSILGLAFAAPYAAAKGGVLQLTRSLAVAWAKDNIQVNCYMPGFIITGQTANLEDDVPGIVAKIEARCPAGHRGVGDDFQGIGVFLASKASDYITGAAIPVDGGFSIAG